MERTDPVGVGFKMSMGFVELTDWKDGVWEKEVGKEGRN